MSQTLQKSIKLYKDTKKKLGDFGKWTDKQVLILRDKMRTDAKKNRGKWTLEFYETLQSINKESIKRKLKQST